MPSQVQSISHRHEGVLKWLMLNPDKTLRECATELGYTYTWISQLIHSDMFQARYRAECEKAGVVAIHTINNRLAGLTATTIEKTLEKLEQGPSERFLGETLKTTLQALGYGASPIAPTNGHGVINITVNGQALIDARERALELKQGGTAAKTLPPAFPAQEQPPAEVASAPPEILQENFTLGDSSPTP